MERDFLGLSDNKQFLNVGERGTILKKKEARQWSYSNIMPASDFQEAKALPEKFQCGLVSAANVFRRDQFGGAFQNVEPLLLGGSVPLTTHSFLVPRVASSRSFPQLTIFYGGNVSVFNDISQEKAQAIMLCAGNGLKDDNSLKQKAERVYGKQIHNAAIAASSSSAIPSESFSTCRDKPVAPTNAMSMIESFYAAPGSMIPSVPQARKASLARFLEKRKERLMSAMPYKKMLLDLSTGESSGMNYPSTTTPP